MGLIYTCRCTACPYRAPNLFEGRGFSGKGYSLFSCPACAEVISAWADHPACPLCGGAGLTRLIILDEEEPHSLPGACPRCGGRLILESKGIWD